MTSNVYAAKRALFTRLGQLTPTGAYLALDGVQFAYGLQEKTLTDRCVYGGRVTFTQAGAEDVTGSGPVSTLIYEIATIDLHIRVRMVPTPVDGFETTDPAAEQIGDAIGHLIHTEPTLVGAGTTLRFSGGQGDYFDEDDSAVSVLTYQVECRSYVDGTT